MKRILLVFLVMILITGCMSLGRSGSSISKNEINVYCMLYPENPSLNNQREKQFINVPIEYAIISEGVIVNFHFEKNIIFQMQFPILASKDAVLNKIAYAARVNGVMHPQEGKVHILEGNDKIQQKISYTIGEIEPGKYSVNGITILERLNVRKAGRKLGIAIQLVKGKLSWNYK